MKKHLEVISYEHKGISIPVKIDYKKGTISLVEYDGNAWKNKKWLFSDRGVEYMKGWDNILFAMSFAIKMAEAALQSEIDSEKEAKDQALIEAMVKMDKAKEEHVE